MNDEQLLRYSRQILLPDIDIKGQQKICDASVLVIGLGGLGSAVAYYLAAAGVGRLFLNDFDQVDESNLQRQIIHNQSRIGVNKADSAAQTLTKLNSDIDLNVIDEKLDEQGMLSIARQCDVIIDGSDNFASRFLSNKVSLQASVPLVSGAAIRMEGQVSVFNQTADSPCYQCLYGDQASELDMSCANNGVLAPLVGMIGSIQAVEALKLITGVGQTLDRRLLLVDIRDMQLRTLNIERNPDCRCH
jgi:adenylyltransferase/sulfurtransferase